MTTIYIPQRIETAEQAEALPIGTVAVNPQDRTEASVRVQNGWHVTGVGKMDGTPSLFKHRDMVGDLALVPIEAEEEWTAMGEDSDGDPWIAHVGHGGIDGTREEAEAYVRRFGGFIAHRALTLWEAQD